MVEVECTNVVTLRMDYDTAHAVFVLLCNTGGTIIREGRINDLAYALEKADPSRFVIGATLNHPLLAGTYVSGTRRSPP